MCGTSIIAFLFVHLLCIQLLGALRDFVKRCYLGQSKYNDITHLLVRCFGLLK